jgi:hypothetical protein
MFPFFILLPPGGGAGGEIAPRKYWWAYCIVGTVMFALFAYLLLSGTFFYFIQGHREHDILWVVLFTMGWIASVSVPICFGLLFGKD